MVEVFVVDDKVRTVGKGLEIVEGAELGTDNNIEEVAAPLH